MRNWQPVRHPLALRQFGLEKTKAALIQKNEVTIICGEKLKTRGIDYELVCSTLNL